MGLKGIGYEGMDWIYVAQDPVAASCERDNEPSHSIRGGEFSD
jgi:hypothetical protein